MEFQGNTSTETVGLETAKMVFNSVVSTPEARFMTINISNLYLNTPLQEYQYMRFNINMIPQEVIDHYGLQNKPTNDGWVYCDICKAIYGLKESRKLANIKLQTVLATEGYKPCRFTHGLYKLETRDIAFLYVVDDFGVKYTNKRDADHLIMTLQKKYPIKMNWIGNYYLGMILKWTYHKIHSKTQRQTINAGVCKQSPYRIQTPLHKTTVLGFTIS